MNKLVAKLVAFVRDEEGLTAVEYAVAGGVITSLTAGAFTLLGGQVDAAITTLKSHIAP